LVIVSFFFWLVGFVLLVIYTLPKAHLGSDGSLLRIVDRISSEWGGGGLRLTRGGYDSVISGRGEETEGKRG
jgi:hypothetical protein